MRILRRFVSYFSFIGIALLLRAAPARAGIIYDTPESIYQQNFDSLTMNGNARPWTNDSTLPGWYGFAPQFVTGVLTGFSGISSSNGTSGPNFFSGSFFTYGASLSTDRAFGATPVAGTGSASVAVAFTNQSANPLDSFTVAYDGEQWRKGQNASAQSLTFSYGIGSNFATLAWQPDVAALQFTSPVFNNNAGTALNGNAAANRVAGITATVSGLDWQVGETLWLRWTDTDNAGEEHSMGIDNFRFSATGDVTAVPEPSSFTLFGLGGAAASLLLFRRNSNTRQSKTMR